MSMESSRLELPAISGCTARLYRGEADIPAMTVVANASSAADGLELKRNVEDMARDYASFTDCDPLHDALLVEVHGELVAYARVWRWHQEQDLMLHGQYGFVRPDWQGRGIGRYLQQWIEARHRESALQHPALSHQHHAFVQQGEKRRRDVIEASGYEAERHFFEMVHPAPASAPDFALPPGLELRPVLPAHYRQIWDSHLEALQDHWGIALPQPEHYERWLKGKIFQPGRWQIAWDIERDCVAGQVKTWIDDDYNRIFERRRGYTEFISVGRPWRRRGLARALVVRSLRTLAEAGMTEAHLGVDSENPSGAVRVYEDCGFRIVKRNTVYRKAVEGKP